MTQNTRCPWKKFKDSHARPRISKLSLRTAQGQGQGQWLTLPLPVTHDPYDPPTYSDLFDPMTHWPIPCSGLDYRITSEVFNCCSWRSISIVIDSLERVNWTYYQHCWCMHVRWLAAAWASSYIFDGAVNHVNQRGREAQNSFTLKH